MGQSPVWALLAAALLGGGVVHYAGRRPAPAEGREARPGRGADEERLSALEARLSAVERRPGAGKGRGPGAQPFPPDPHDPAPASAAGSAPAAGAAPLVDDPVFGEAVRDVLAQREEERRAARKERLQRRFDDRLAELKVDLGLTPDQATRVEKVLREAMEQRLALWEGGEGEQLSGRERRERARALRDDVDRKLAEVLTPEQKQQYDEEVGEWGGGRRGGAARDGSGRGGGRLGDNRAPDDGRE